MKVCPAFLFVSVLCACRPPIGPLTSTTHVAVSPDQKHVVIIVGNSGRSVDVETGADAAVLDDLDWRSPFGGFSADGSVFLTRTAAGHLLVTPASGGRPVDFGEALDMGQLSPDGSLVAVLRNKSQCSDRIVCADLVVLPARGGDGAVVVRGFRLVVNPGRPAGLDALDQYQFAGNARILFTNALGELWSMQVDGSAPVRIAESHRSLGGGGPYGGPLPPAWAVTPDGSRVAYSHAAGVSIQPVAGGPATLLGTDPDAVVPCGRSFQNQYASNPVCAFAPDGANVILQGFTPGAYYLKSVPITGGAPTTLSPTSGAPLGFLADGRYLFIGANYSYAFASIPGEIRTVPRNPDEFACATPSCVSPDGKWVTYLTGSMPGSSCNPCFTVRMVSAAGGEASWTVSDASGPLRLAGVESRSDSSPVSLAPDSSSLVVIRRYGESDSPYPIGDLEMFPIAGGPGRLIAERVAYAVWAGPRHVVYERYIGQFEPEIHVQRVR